MNANAVKRVLALNAVFLVMMSAVRAVFFLRFVNWQDVGGLWGYVFRAFLLGVRFDLVIVAYINTLVTLTLLIVWAAGKSSWFEKWILALRWYYFFMFSLVFLILSVDIGFYSYFKNHINILIFGILEDDTRALFSTILENYNIPLVLSGYALLFGLIYALCRFILPSGRQYPPVEKKHPLAVKLALALGLVAVNALAARGSLKMFPLVTMDAAISPNTFINKLSVNGINTLYEALEFRMKEKNGYDLTSAMGYEKNIAEAFAVTGMTDTLTRTTARNAFLEKNPPNVVFIMMEGFGSDLIKYDSPDFNVLGELKKHFDGDYVFYNFLSSDVGTIGSLEAVLLNVPKRPQSKPVTQSEYAFGEFPSGMAHPFKRAGYDTMFMYGGSIGWRNLDTFVQKLGFDAAVGDGGFERDYLKNQWGVYDEFLFDYIYEKLSNKSGRPKFICALTTSNHPPYSLPPGYNQLPINVSQRLESLITGDGELARKRFMTYQYACQRLGEFITRIKNSEQGSSTIIAVTGDHNFWDVFEYPAERQPDMYGVPLYLYVPPAYAPKDADTSVCGSHVDIMPTLYNLALSSMEYVALGNDLFDSGAPHVGFNSDGFIIARSGAARYGIKDGSVQCYRWDENRRLAPVPADPATEEAVRYMKASMALTEYYVRNTKHPTRR